MSKAISPSDYRTFLAALKNRILHARTTAARAVNQELVRLYWDIGRGILEKQRLAGWGDAVVERLAADLRSEFSDMRGFSADNLWRIRQFYAEYSDSAFLEQAVPEISKSLGRFLEQAVPESIRLESGAGRTTVPKRLTGKSAVAIASAQRTENLMQLVRQLVAGVPWGHHIELMKKVKDAAARFYYLRAVVRLGWSRSVLLNQIKAGAFERALKEKKSHNFALALPEHLAEQADEMLKSRYNLEFLGLARAMKERELEDRLVGCLQQFILELGYGFCFVGRQFRLALGTKEYFVDLLFYHRFLKTLVAFDLKIGPFEPEHAGKMDFYLNLLNDKERGPDDQPSIGIILCAGKNDVEVEFALKSKTNPIGVAEYRLQPRLPAEFRGRLPTTKQLADVVRKAREENESGRGCFAYE